ncbi:MAG: hypothetical protein LBF69_00470 [Prevotellaceae bacterium]|jgi:hypothetical protein|nr:hypothetical protein [Prevotellaceae bacterium]
MNATSQLKVIAAGFTIIRADDHPAPRIKHKQQGIFEWKTLEKFLTKAARDRRMAELLNDPMVIED